MRSFASLLAPSLALIALVGCEPSGKKDASASPESDSLVGHASLDSFLVQRYGLVPDRVGVPSSEGWALRICADSTVGIDGAPHRLVAICRINAAGSHAEGGLTDAYLFRIAGSRLIPVAQDTARESGNNGTPGEIAFARLGRQEWGVQTVSGFLGQGNYEEALEWRVFSGDTARTILYLSTLSSNEGTIECAEDSLLCASHTTRVSIDASDSTLDRYPVDLLDTLLSGGVAETRRLRLAFDSAKGAWIVPPLLGEVADGN